MYTMPIKTIFLWNLYSVVLNDNSLTIHKINDYSEFLLRRHFICMIIDLCRFIFFIIIIHGGMSFVIHPNSFACIDRSKRFLHKFFPFESTLLRI